ncbi:MAG TPA: glycosyltransferase family 9 protein [Candidatus Nanoarchaeia archaeon]|nr:glycosyltransferase family 9 protein [Candidatus Nanoarchaeia archaeon]
MANPKWNRDCRSFNPQYACDVLRAENYPDCAPCKFYEPFKKKILIIKLGAMGDVLRTTPLLPLIKKKYPDCHITWLVKEESIPLLRQNQGIDKTLPFKPENLLRLKYEKFDVLINLEISPEATIASNLAQAKEKYGYYFHEDGNPRNYNKQAEFYLNRVYSNQINKTNRKTYQEMMSEIAELEYDKQPYSIQPTAKEYAEAFSRTHGLTSKDKIIGINIGSAGRWPSKAWHPDNLLELAKKLHKEKYKLILLGGPEEQASLPALHHKLVKERIPAIMNNPENTIQQFVSVMSLCKVIITSDSLALHIAIGLKKPTIALFFCTPPWEIEDYGVVKKLTSPLLEQYFYTDEYSEELVKSISPEQVFNQILEIEHAAN